MNSVPDLRVISRSSLRNSRGWKSGPAALHGLDEHRGEFVGVFAQDLQRLGRAVVEHQHVLRGVGHDARRRRHRAQLARAAHDDFIEDAVIRAGEQRDLAAAGHGARDAQATHDGFRAGVAQAGAIEAGEFADQLGHFARERVLRADLVTLVQLLAHRVEHEVRLPAEEAHAEAVERVDVFVAVEIPDVRALRTVDDDLVDDFLELRAEAIHHARIGQVRAMFGGVFLRLLRARDVAAHESAEARLLPLGQFAGRLGVDARDGAERLLHVVGFLAAVFFGGRGAGAAGALTTAAVAQARRAPAPWFRAAAPSAP